MLHWPELLKILIQLSVEGENDSWCWYCTLFSISIIRALILYSVEFEDYLNTPQGCNGGTFCISPKVSSDHHTPTVHVGCMATPMATPAPALVAAWIDHSPIPTHQLRSSALSNAKWDTSLQTSSPSKFLLRTHKQLISYLPAADHFHVTLKSLIRTQGWPGHMPVYKSVDLLTLCYWYLWYECWVWIRSDIFELWSPSNACKSLTCLALVTAPEAGCSNSFTPNLHPTVGRFAWRSEMFCTIENSFD